MTYADYFSRGVTNFENKQYALSISDFKMAIFLNPIVSVNAYTNLGSLFYILNQYDHAIESITEALSQEPNKESAITLLIKLLTKASNHDQRRITEYSLCLVLKITAKSNEKNKIQLLELVEKLNDTMQSKYVSTELEKNKTMMAAYYNKQGDAYFENEQYMNAIDNYTKAINLNPSAQTHCARGRSHFFLKQYETALTDYNRAIELSSEYSWVYDYRGHTHLLMKNFDLAIVDLTRFIEQHPNNSVAYINRGCARGSLGEFDLAIADFNKAIELKPESKTAYNNRGYIYFKQKKYDLAIADLTKVMKLDSGFELSLINLDDVLTEILQNHGGVKRESLYLVLDIIPKLSEKEEQNNCLKLLKSINEHIKSENYFDKKDDLNKKIDNTLDKLKLYWAHKKTGLANFDDDASNEENEVNNSL